MDNKKSQNNVKITNPTFNNGSHQFGETIINVKISQKEIIDQEEIIDRLLKSLKDKDTELQDKKPSPIQKIALILNNNDSEKRIKAAQILGDNGDYRMIKPIMERIEIEIDDTVMYWLLIALGDLFRLNCDYEQDILQLLKRLEETGTQYVQSGISEAKKNINSRYKKFIF
jgi:HEAT repeat protein